MSSKAFLALFGKDRVRGPGLVLSVGLLSFGLAACSYQGAIDNPTTIKATWFSYLNGDDIRQACAEGATLRYRLVYNADYDEQLRSYELVGDGAGGAALTARVQGPSGLVVSKLRLDDPLAWARWTTSQAALDAPALGRLDEALERSGAFGPAPTGLRLFSKETYWVSSLCKDGVFSFNAWVYPSERFDEISFNDLLFGHDATGVTVRPPQAIAPGERFHANVPRRRQSDDDRGNTFNLQVGENGLAGYLAL
ncbi:hypothetical protein HBA54_27515 [Pelagibius litoralis]|uniref:Lipoprotein n=1 Tax=Pelagibius litoralis TaxID=374515 RepID=A0A967KFB3_9PROT|nr:hypothetical protein [Pelagibius litoralis]NIA72344.1 hypothetical protein [Pelagibius litoralis]